MRFALLAGSALAFLLPAPAAAQPPRPQRGEAPATAAPGERRDGPATPRPAEDRKDWALAPVAEQTRTSEHSVTVGQNGVSATLDSVLTHLASAISGGGRMKSCAAVTSAVERSL